MSAHYHTIAQGAASNALAPLSKFAAPNPQPSGAANPASTGTLSPQSVEAGTPSPPLAPGMGGQR